MSATTGTIARSLATTRCSDGKRRRFKFGNIGPLDKTKRLVPLAKRESPIGMLRGFEVHLFAGLCCRSFLTLPLHSMANNLRRSDGSMSDQEKKGTPNVPTNVPQAVVSRLSLYLRELQHLRNQGTETVSSSALGKLLGFSDAQVRKDLTHFGQFGHPGVGYRCDQLIQAIRRILGTDRHWPVAIVGMGNLGRALLRYKGFQQQGFRIIAAFDVDPLIVGQTLEGIRVHSIDDLPAVAREKELNLAIIAVPAESAQSVADALIEAGVDGILNFAPVTINLPPSVKNVAVDLAIELEQLTFAVLKKSQN